MFKLCSSLNIFFIVYNWKIDYVDFPYVLDVADSVMYGRLFTFLFEIVVHAYLIVCLSLFFFCLHLNVSDGSFL